MTQLGHIQAIWAERPTRQPHTLKRPELVQGKRCPAVRRTLITLDYRLTIIHAHAGARGSAESWGNDPASCRPPTKPAVHHTAGLNLYQVGVAMATGPDGCSVQLGSDRVANLAAYN